MAGQGRVHIPGLFDSSEESEDISAPPSHEIVIDPATPEPCGEEVVLQEEDEEEQEASSVEGDHEEEPEVEDEEVEEYDPTAPFIVRKPPNLAHSSAISAAAAADDDDETAHESADETAPELEPESTEGQKVEESKKEAHYFVVDVLARCLRILPRGFDEKKFVVLEGITDASFTQINERVYNPNYDDDDHFYCEPCVMSYRVCCMKHPLYRILDRKTETPGPCEGRAKKTLPAFMKIKTSSIPKAGEGAFTGVELPVGVVFGPYQGILSKELDDRGYSWEIRNVDAPSMFLDGSNEKYSNWMRYINSPRHDREQNLVAFQYNGSVYYRVIKPIDIDQELLVWYGDKFGESLPGVHSTKRRISTKNRSNDEYRNNYNQEAFPDYMAHVET